VWQAAGSITGLRARGGFELVSLQWKNGQVVKATVKSTLGGNLRLRTPNTLQLNGGAALKEASGENSNDFYQKPVIATPIVSPQANIALPQLKTTFLYDIPTQPGKLYILVIK
jgi:alpha-L-fucosidase 2